MRTFFCKLSILACATAFQAWAYSSNAQDNQGPQNDNIATFQDNETVKPAIKTASNDKYPKIADAGSGKTSIHSRRVERQKRQLQDTMDDLNYSFSLAGEDMARLGGMIDEMTLLEPPKREFDLRSLLDWYNGYSDWLKDMAGECEDRLETMTANSGQGENPGTLYAALAAKNRTAEREVENMTGKYESELQRLFRIIDRRKLLNDTLQDLRNQLSEIEDKIGGQQSQSPDRMQGEKKADRIRNRISVTQTELVSLYDIKEELLKHYVVMIEMGRDEAFWLELKAEEYGLLRDASGFMGKDGSKNIPALEGAYRRMIRGCESEIKRIGRKMDELDRKSSGISPAGSFRDLDRSRDLSDFYQDRKQRYAEYINRLKTREGSLEADLSEIMSR